MFLIPLLGVWFQPTFAAFTPIKETAPLEITESEYKFIEDHVAQMQEKLPSEKYVYAPLGTAMTSFAAYFDIMGIDSFDLPASGLRKALNIEFRTAEDKKLLRDHFLKYLPAKEDLHGRKVLIIDHALTGLSLARVANYIRGLFGKDYPIETLAFVYEDYDRDFSRMIDHKIVFKNKEQLTRFVTKRHEDYAPHGSANIVDNLQELSDIMPNSKYGLLVSAMRKARSLYACEPKLD